MNNLFNNIKSHKDLQTANKVLCDEVRAYVDLHEHSMYASDNIRKKCRVCNPEKHKETYFEFLIKKLRKFKKLKKS